MSKADYKFSSHLGGHGLLHTPEGVRDIYNGECARKLAVQERMHHVLKLYGFKDIQTPMFEFFDIFNKERGTIASKEMYKFFDREGNTLVLRPDITPSIARSVAKYFKEEELPLRLCYMGNTFINNNSYQGKLKETTQVGAELINDSSADADAEMIALTIECLKTVGLEEFQVEIGHADFLLGLLEEAELNGAEQEELKNLIEDKNLFGVEALISSKDISGDLKELMLKLPGLFGNHDNLMYAKTKTKNARALHAITRLEKLYHILESYGLSHYVTFDLGMLSKYNYYTGIIFQAFTYGTGEPIVKGGRYGNLLEQFGKKAPAIGLAIEVDQLMLALSRQKIQVETENVSIMILYQSEFRTLAIDLVNQFRKDDIKVELVRKSSKHSLEEYKEHAKSQEITKVILLDNIDVLKSYDLLSNCSENQKIKDMLK